MSGPPSSGGATRHWPVVVAGAGPVGLTAAIDLALRGIDVLLVDEDDTVSVGSRAICWSKRTLEILDRLGCARAAGAKGRRLERRPGFLSRRAGLRIQPAARARVTAGRRSSTCSSTGSSSSWSSALSELAAGRAALAQQGRRRRAASRPRRASHQHARRRIHGACRLADRRRRRAQPDSQHARARMRRPGLPRSLPDRRHPHDAPAFRPSAGSGSIRRFIRNQSALLHRQADDVWRVDFQLGWDADPEEEKKPERIVPRIRAMLGDDAQFEIEWASVYTFQCRRMRSFRHGRVLFAGDAAHLVSPFGARGANSRHPGRRQSGVEARAGARRAGAGAPARQLRRRACATRPTRTSGTRRAAPISSRRRATCQPHVSRRRAGPRQAAPVRAALVNSGRLSLPATLAGSPLNTPDSAGDAFGGGLVPGAVAPTRRSPVRAAAGCSVISTAASRCCASAAPCRADAVRSLAARRHRVRGRAGRRGAGERRLPDRGQ